MSGPGLRSKRDVYVVAVRAHPRVSCAVRGVEGRAWAVARKSCMARVCVIVVLGRRCMTCRVEGR